MEDIETEDIPIKIAMNIEAEDLNKLHALEEEDSERKELEEEWIKICKKEYQLFENVKNKEEMLKSKKLKLKGQIKERYEFSLEAINSNNDTPVEISVDNEDFCYIKQLNFRQDLLKERAEKLEEEIQLANKDKTFVSHDKTSFLLKEKIHEFLYENEVLEKYVRGEYFRSFDETITALNHSLNLLEKDRDTLYTVKKQLEQEESTIQETIMSLKKEYKVALGSNEQIQDELESYNRSSYR